MPPCGNLGNSTQTAWPCLAGKTSHHHMSREKELKEPASSTGEKLRYSPVLSHLADCRQGAVPIVQTILWFRHFEKAHEARNQKCQRHRLEKKVPTGPVIFTPHHQFILPGVCGIVVFFLHPYLCVSLLESTPAPPFMRTESPYVVQLSLLNITFNSEDP